MSNIGYDFEKDLSKELGLERVPGSGNKASSKLDLKGWGMRWSLKATEKKSASISQKVIDEAIDVCYGPGGDGSLPVWAFRIGDSDYDMIMIRKKDFKLLQQGEFKIGD